MKKGGSAVDLAVVFSPVGGGHKAAALAIVEEAKARGLRVELVNAFDHAPRWAGDAYLAAHLTGQNAIPELYGHLYENANRRDGVFEPLRHEIDNLLFGDLLKRVQSLAPSAIIATHHLPLVVLGRARTKGLLAAPLIGVVTDYTSHACWAEDGVDRWAVPCAEAERELAEHGAPRDRIVTSGIPVRRAFEQIPALRVSRGERLQVLVTSGGFGAAPMTRIVRSFEHVVNVDLTVVCGAKASKLEARVARAAEEAGVSAKVIGFENDMPRRMAEAHVVVGKAGGLTVTETMTAGRPMVIASAVPGNEKLNEARVVTAGAGVAASPEDVGLIVEALRDQGLLESMGRKARALVPCCSASRILDSAFDVLLRHRVAA